MKRSLWLRRMAAVTALALAAAACGGNGDDTDEPEPTETETAEETEEPDETEEPEATETETEDGGSATGDGTLNLGYVLPESGQLAFLGPPMINAVNMALEDINAAGGVLGQEVTLSTGDEAGDAAIASEAAQRLIGEGVDAIVGAAASGMSLAIVDAVTGAGALQCSPSNTGPAFTTGDYNGLYARTAPTDALQGVVLAELIVADGNTSPALLGRADEYGQGLVAAAAQALESQGATVAAEIIYDGEAANFEAEVNQVADSGADSVVIIGFQEGAQILASLIEAGMGPGNVNIYTADGMASEDLAASVNPNDPSVLEGMKGTRPATVADEGFLDRFKEFAGIEDTTYAPQAYDCAILIALAAEAGGSDAGTDIAANMVSVTTGDTECASFQECKDALAAGDTIAYQSVAGVTLMETESGNLEPDSGSYEVWEFDAEGGLNTLEVVETTFQ